MRLAIVVTTMLPVARIKEEESEMVLMISALINCKRSCITEIDNYCRLWHKMYWPWGGNDKKYCLILFFNISPAKDLVESDCWPNSGKLADNIIAKIEYYQSWISHSANLNNNENLGTGLVAVVVLEPDAELRYQPTVMNVIARESAADPMDSGPTHSYLSQP